MSEAQRDVVDALRASLKERDRLRRENTRLLTSANEPIAIVGMACRYPGGADSPEALWGLVAAGEDGIEGFPVDRGWDLERLYDPDPDSPGTSYAREGGFLRDATEFDAEFFDISPREALATDPQQRLLLEACWEALESAGVVPSSLRGSQTGVFAGLSLQDYEPGQSGDGELEGYRATGAAGSVLSGRIAYTLGLEGPAMTIDTACSSSLVAMHLAAGALRGGECSLALAGGVTFLSTPGVLVEFSRQRGLAPDGRCKAFAEAADGVGWAEGVGMLVLERLSDAQREGHPILATIKGSAVNQDGASNGLTAPNGPSQERVIRQALANARLSPQDIDAVEAHGTGTTLGDPIEAGALLATYGQDRERPLKLGSIKSNIGHTQAAAGVAGVIKTVMAMREGILPKTLHVDAPSSKVDWGAGEIELLREAEPWQANGRPRRASVSSFGISGTNAHLILEQAPAAATDTEETEGPSQEQGPAPLPGPIPLLLSAKTDTALQAQASRLASHLNANPELELTDVAFSLATTRASFEHRGAVVGSERSQLLEGLGALAQGAESPTLLSGLARSAQSPAFLFAGQGSQHAGMALELLESSAAFAHHMAECEQALSPHVEWSLQEVLREEQGSWLEHLDIVQPALFAVMVSLAKLWQEVGVEAAVVVGHSQGEIAAAHIAGALSLGDAALVIARRAQAMAGLAGKGGMLSVSLPVEEMQSRLEPFGERLSLAAINGPASLVISGEPKALAELQAACEKDGVRSQAIAVDYAAHSAQIEDLREELLEAFAPISPRSGQIPFHSTLSGELLDTADLDADYWYRNLRHTVRFEPVLRSLLEQGQRAFLEISPHPVLAFGVQEAIDALPEAKGATVIETLRRDQGGPGRFALSLAQAHSTGIEVQWQDFFKGTGAKAVELPTYAFQRKRYWLNASAGAGDASSIGQEDPEHPLLSALIEDPAGEALTFTGRLSLATHPWLADHAVAGVVLLPGTAFLELALRAGEEAGCETVEELVLQAPLVLPEAGAVRLRVSVGEPGESGERSVSIHSLPEGEESGGWSCHAEGTLSSRPVAALDPPAAWPPPGAEPIDVTGLYDRLVDAGFEYGPAFQGLTAAWRRGEELFAEVSLAPEHAQQAERFLVHPALLDSALHGGLGGVLDEVDGAGGKLLLPFAWREVRVHSRGAASLRVRVALGGEEGSLNAVDEASAAVVSVGAVITREVDPSSLRSTARSGSLYRVKWSEAPLASGARDAPLAIVGENGLTDLGAECHADLAALLRAVDVEAVPATVLVDAGCEGRSEAGLPEAVHATARRALELAQEWLAEEKLRGSRLALLTHGAISTGAEESPDLVSAPLWGLLRSAQTENPGRFLLIDSDGTEESLRALPAALEIEDEPQLAIREGRLLVPRLAAAAAPGEEPMSRPIDPDSTVLITGATGGLGRIVARHLLTAHKVRHLLLASRSGEGAAGAEGLAAELGGLGAEVRIAACDVAEREQLERLIESIPAGHPLGAVIHCAGVLEDGVLETIDRPRLDRVMRPKVDAAWHLHELTERMDLSAFVMFSSAAGTLGGAGQASYAAANTFLDALAQHRRGLGQAATSIAWGPWQTRTGMTAELDDVDLARFERSGTTALSDEQGLALFDAALAAPEALSVPIRLGSSALRAMASAGALPAILRGLVRLPTRSRSAIAGSLSAKLASLSEAEREAAVLKLVRGEVAVVLAHGSASSVDPSKAFKELGFDSLTALELRNRLGAATGMRLPTTLVFDYPTPAALAKYLLAEATRNGAARRPSLPVQASDEPIAIVGMACRYPGGADSPEALWGLVAAGEDGIEGFPVDRGWDLERLYDPDPDSPGTSYAREGGFLRDATEFDAEFFDISPREALATDPQQRLLLEACWEALESAGVVPSSLRGSQTGVFAGLSLQDYEPGQSGDGELEGYRATGAAGSVLSGRIAYTLGLEGPAMTIDTACSSSLVAMHLAAGALRGGECSLALAGGVTFLSTPGVLVEFSRQRGLAPDGRCKSFSESADGTGFSEGVGMLVLERLSDAQREGHPILATIKGSAVNQDGASNGLTAPNGPSQERVIRQALANARLSPQDIDAVEAHGTGTTLGDPIEAGALLATYGQDRERPLKLGSIKSNIGHTQAAAGVAGVIKTVMAMREGILPKTLHVDAPSSKVDWGAGEIELLREAEPWQANGRPRRASVSSFGISGTNAHLILEQAPAAATDTEETEGPSQEQGPAPLPGPIPLLLSAKTDTALQAQASRLASHLNANPELELTDVAFSLATTRASFEHRGAVVGSERSQLLEGLGALAQGAESPTLLSGLARSAQSPAFLFAGQGSQHAGMALELLESSAAFAHHMAECEQALSPHVEWSLQEVLREEQGSWLEHLDIVQPALFAVMVSLAKLWQEVGVEAAVVVGHSQGEIAAAHIAGALSLGDAALVIARRAQAMAGLAGKGGMLSVSLPVEEMQSRLEPFGERLSLAAINGPASLVISGEPKALAELQAACEKDGVRSQAIAVDYAAHSAQIEDLREELLEAFAPISPRSGQIPFHSTLSGELLDTADLDADYWYRNLRHTVRFEPVLRSLLEQGQRAFLEISPHPVLAFGVQEAIDALPEAKGATVIETLRRDQGGPGRFALSLAQAHSTGIEVQWQDFFKGTGAKAVELPTYAFQRKRYWLNASAGAGDASSIGQEDPEHPLLSALIEDPAGEALTFTGRLSLATHPWLADHAVAGVVLLPGTAFLELALRAGEEAGCETVEELVLQAPLVLPEAGAVQIQVVLGVAGENGERPLSIHSRSEARGEAEGGEWACHAEGTLSPREGIAADPLEPWPPAAAEPLTAEFLYDRLAESGLDYGPAFQGLEAAWLDGEDVCAEISLRAEQAAEAKRFGVHPALLDAALHSIALLPGRQPEAALQLPFSWSGVSLTASGASRLRVRLSSRGEEGVSLSLADGEGASLARIEGLALRAIDPSRLGGTPTPGQGLLTIEWQPVSLSATASPATLWEPAINLSVATMSAAARAAAAEALERVQSWLSEEENADRRLAVLTRGAIATGVQESPDPIASSVWGLLRSAQSEHPGRFVLIDTDGSEASAETLDGALRSERPQLALREGVALVPRAVSAGGKGDSLIAPSGPWRLDAPERGSLEGLALVPNPAALEPLGPGDVRIAMHAAGLNFRDVLVVLGFAVPGEGALGGDGAGVVLEVGSEVDDLSPGDRVMGLIPEGFGPTAVCDRRLLVPVPGGWSFEQAAAVPVVCLTAYYGLVELADLQPGEKLLVHAGAGGVGMAAIQLAKHLGAEVFATASPSKWGVLRQIGIPEERIASSRDLEFKQKFLAATGGQGVDVVLNSLAREFVDASLELLPHGGRFMEMGRTDIREAEQVAADHPGVAYRAFDLVELGPEDLQRMLTEIAQLFERGVLRHPPIKSWDLRRAPEAFRYLREGQNVGKVVLRIPRPLDPDRTTLITGATGGLGSLLARHLAQEHGARHLLLASRSGEQAAGAKELKADLKELGAEATIVACDVSERSQLEELLASIAAEHPLGAVIHAAGALQDGVIESLDKDQLQPVFGPKADAAWHLHELTEGMDLSAFVMFSSAAAVLGAPGQANYAAANAFLDALASYRRAQGLPASSIAWGLWQRESAMTAHLEEADLARMARSGVEALADEIGLELFEQALGSERAETLALGLDRAGLRAQASAGLLPDILSALVRTPARRRSGAGSSLAQKLASTPEVEREALVLDLVGAEVAAVLGHGSAAEVEPTRAFKELGFDSLAAVELRNRLQIATGLRLAATTVFDYPSPAALAGFLAKEATAGAAAAPVAVRAQASEQPIAIVGMACRYPGGVGSPEELWQLVAAGVDAISEFPVDRGWDLERLFDSDPEVPGTSYTRQGGFLAGAAEFDAEFFGIGPREALATDPQQRLLLEASWEALESAGIDPSLLGGTAAGVFAGISSQDYAAGLRTAGSELEGYLSTGSLTSVVSGRIAYTLGLEGPAMTIDTACSSSLVAMHLAAGALRGGECSLALAGGVTVLSSPVAFTEFSRQRALAPDGRCKSFAEAADGTSWSEGAGMLVLERLSDAQREGHPILATIKGSAVNQDGASNGLTAPNGPSQERVIRQALANARLSPQDIDAVEAHGTGTTLGDPIEAGALLATYGQDRERPLKLGSIKSNIGHTHAAAGVAGVIKTVMAMREGVLPKTLHVDVPSSKVDWETGEVELLREAEPWRANGKPRRAGVSSFGISGTNAHVILEEAPGPSETEQGGGARGQGEGPLPRPIPLLLSAKSEAALEAQAKRLGAHLQGSPGLDLADVAFSLATTRTTFEHRAAAVGRDREELLAGLSALGRGERRPNAVSGRATPAAKLAYLFSGQGSQRPGMGSELYEAYPAYKEALDDLCAELDSSMDRPLAEILCAGPGTPEAELLDDTTYAQPALFVIEVALFRLLESWGFSPDLLAGHSIGEISAAHLAGVLSLPDAARLVAARGSLMGGLPEGGAMVAIEATEQEAGASIEGREAELSIAAINGPGAVVLSGVKAAVDEVEAHWEGLDRKTKRLAVSHAFHSPLIEPALAQFEAVARSLDYNEPQIPIVSALSGGLLGAEQATDPAYWVAHAREPVRFADAVSGLRAQGATSFIELGPDAVLAAMAQECLVDDVDLALVATMRRERPEATTLNEAVVTALAAGVEVDWESFFEGAGVKAVPLPTYPFQRKRYWLNAASASGDAVAAGLVDADHPLLSAVIEDPASEALTFSGRLSLSTQPWLADHAVAGIVLLPGTAFVELALRAGEEAGCETIEELALHAPLIVPERGAVQLQLSVGDEEEDGKRSLSIHSRPEAASQEQPEEWTLHAQGTLSAEEGTSPEPLEPWPPTAAEALDAQFLYDRLAEAGFDYGPAFQGLEAAWLDGEDVCAEISLLQEQAGEAERFGLHPALLDAALHAIALLPSAKSGAALQLPFSWSGVSLVRSGASSLRVRLSLRAEDGVSLHLADGEGVPLARVDSLALRAIDPSLLSGSPAPRHGLLAIEWQPATLDVGATLARLWELASDPSGATKPEAARAAAAEALEQIQGWLAEEEGPEQRLAILTRGAIATSAKESPDPAAASVWGLVRSAQSEHPGRFVLIDTDGSEASAETLDAALRSEQAQLVLREGVALAPRAVRSASPAKDEERGRPLDPDRTTLITGATGGLGSLLARHLAQEHGARHLLLASRSGEQAAGAKELKADLKELGAEATIVACDVSERSQLEELLASIAAEHPLGAVIHAAGALQDGVIESLDKDQLQPVFGPKADAAWHLHELTEGMDLSAFVMFSSAAAVLGAPGQANYAAANAFLDALASYRRAQGLPASSIAWGLWQRESAMTAHLEEADLARMARSGVEALADEIGLELFEQALGSERAETLALGLDRAGLRAQASAGLLPDILSALVRTPARRRSGAGSSLAQKLASTPEVEREALVLDLVGAEVAAVLGHGSAAEVEPTRAFKELGFDSLAAVELRNRLQVATGLRLAATTVFDYPSPAALAGFLAGSLVHSGSEIAAGELRQLTQSLTALPAGDADRMQFAIQLRTLAANLEGEDGRQAGAFDSSKLKAASDEELLDFIDAQVGSSGAAEEGPRERAGREQRG